MKQLNIFIIAIMLLAVASCKKVDKQTEAAFPKVETTSVTQQADGSVLVTGNILSAGSKEIVLAGFCMDTLPHPDALSNQQSVSVISGTTFTTVYKGLDKLHKYYFRAWAANDNGYAMGGDVSIDSVSMSSSNIPCDLPLDSITYVNTYKTTHEKLLSIGNIRQSAGTWEIDMYTNSHSITLTLGAYPIDGIYKTVGQGSNVGSTNATFQLDGYQSDGGANVYVKVLNSKTVEITICSEKVYDGTFDDTISTKFQASF